MFATPPPARAAWAPWGGGSTEWLLRRDRLAAFWLVRAADAHKEPIVVQAASGAADYRRIDGPLGDLARMGKVATYRVSVGPGATYVHHATIRLLATAMRPASGRSLAVSEIPTLPLRGWAMAVGAIDLLTGEPTVDVRTSEQTQLVAQFVDQLYNGWSHKEVGKRACRYYLPKLVETGMTYAEFVGSVIAMDPGHLDSTSDIEAMRKALPPVWAEECRALTRVWD